MSNADRGSRAGKSLAWQALGSLALAGGLASTAQAAAPSTIIGATDANQISGVDVVSAGRVGGETGLSVMATNVRDTPQAINLVPGVQLEQQKLVTLEQALRNVPGITVSIGEGGTLNGDQFRIRGQEAQNDVYLDGLRDFGVYTRDTFNLNEIQVLKGPSGALFGRGTTGGVINSVTKAANLREESRAEVAVGTAAFYRATADVNRPIGQTAALRLNAMVNHSHVASRNLIRSRRWGLGVSAGVGLGTRTSVLLNYLHQQDNRIPDYGIIILQPPGSIIAKPASEYGVPRKNFLGLVTDRDRTKADVFTAKFNHQATPLLTLTSDSRVGVYSRYFQYSTLDTCAAACVAAFFDGNPATEAFGGYGGSGPYHQQAWGAQNITTARYEGAVFGLKSLAILGFDLSYQRNRRQIDAYALPAAYPVRNTIPRPIVNPDPRVPAGYAVIVPTLANIAGSSATATYVTRNDGESTDYGAFVTERLWLNSSLSVLGSLRVDDYRAEFDTVTVAGTFTPIKSKSTLTNPRVSLVWEPGPGRNLYASFGKSATPQGTGIVANATGIAATTRDLQPEKNKSYEAGAKLGFLGGRVMASAAVFKVVKNNATQRDPATSFILAQSGERQRIQGVELGLTGKLAKGWTINAAYAYLDSKILESFLACTATTLPCPAGVPASTLILNPYVVGRPVLLTPKNSGSVFTNYEFDGALKGLAVGATANFQGGFPSGYTTGPTGLSRIPTIPHSVSVDAVVSYEWSNYRLAINGSNLTDRLNYGQVFTNRAVPAPGRAFVLTVGARF